ncbi:hypothetical protein AAVH_09509 [Aphelenchoides avenae]|nr:hypothetical protein AAVH_09509 [Aphelenchus avenae]
MDRPALFTAIAVGYAVGFMHSLDFAVVDVTLNVNGLQEVLQFAQMTPYAVSQHIKALRRCGGLVGYMLVFVYFAATHRSKRRRWTRTLFQAFANYLGRLCGLILAITLSPGLCFFVHTILIWSTAVATFSANRSLRNYGQEDYESLADQRAMSVKQSQTLAPYRSPAFLRALLAVGIPMTLLGNGPRRVRDEIVFANGSIGTFFLYENIARALLGGLLLSYNVIHKDYATVKKADDWKRAMLWSACVSLVIVASSVPGSQSGWYVSFVVADTMLASYWMNAASCFMPGLFPEGTNQAGMCLAWIVRLGWKLAAEPMVLWSLELFGIRFFMWSNVALRVLCTLTVIFATCILQRRDRDPHSRAANGSMIVQRGLIMRF